MDALKRLLIRLAAAGVAEPSTLVIEFMPAHALHNDSEFRVATAMSSRVPVPNVNGAIFHPTGLVDGYCTYELPALAIDEKQIDVKESLSSMECLAFGLRHAVEMTRSQGVPVRRFVATGSALFREMCRNNPTQFQTFANVLGERISLRPVDDVEQVGRRVLDASAIARREGTAYSWTVHAVAGHMRPTVLRRDLDEARRYDAIWKIMRPTL